MQSTGSTVARQQEMIDEWLAKHPDYVLGGLRFQDLGLSGYHGKHLKNGFGKLLAAIELNHIKAGDFCLVESVDRLGRINPSDMLNILTGILGAGVSIITLDDGVVYSRDAHSANNLFLLVAKCQQAWNYSDALSRRVKKAYEIKRDKAKAGTNIYTKRRTPMWLKDTGTKIVVIDELAPIMKQVFTDFLAGIGERRILARVRTQHPLLADINASTLKRWLRNPTVIGWWQPRPINGVVQDPIKDVYPPVISEHLWHLVQKKLDAGKRIKRASNTYMLTGLVKCGVCAMNFGVVNYHYMVCMDRHRNGVTGCSNSKSIPYTVLDYIRSQTMQSAMLRATASTKLTIGEKRLIEIEGELYSLQQQSTRLADSLAEFGMLPPIRAKLNTVMDSIKLLEREQRLLNVTPSQDTLSDMIDMENILLDDDPMRLNALLQGVDYQIVCNGSTITVEEQSLSNDAGVQTYEYKGVSKRLEAYILIENGVVEHQLPTPTSKKVDAAQEEFENTPITQELQWNGEHFIDVATGEIVNIDDDDE